MHIFSCLNDILIIERTFLRQRNVYDALGYGEGISQQLKLMVNNFPVNKGNDDYSKGSKEMYEILYRMVTFLPLFAFDEEANEKRYA